MTRFLSSSLLMWPGCWKFFRRRFEVFSNELSSTTTLGRLLLFPQTQPNQIHVSRRTKIVDPRVPRWRIIVSFHSNSNHHHHHLRKLNLKSKILPSDHPLVQRWWHDEARHFRPPVWFTTVSPFSHLYQAPMQVQIFFLLLWSSFWCNLGDFGDGKKFRRTVALAIAASGPEDPLCPL